MKTPAHCIHARRPDRRGAAAVEFAVVAPLFLLFILALFEFGWAMMAQGILVNAAQEGARTGVLDGMQASDVTDAVNRYLDAAGLPAVTPVISPNPPSSASAGQDVAVSLSLPFSQVSLLPVPCWLGGVTLTASSALRRETSQ